MRGYVICIGLIAILCAGCSKDPCELAVELCHSYKLKARTDDCLGLANIAANAGSERGCQLLLDQLTKLKAEWEAAERAADKDACKKARAFCEGLDPTFSSRVDCLALVRHSAKRGNASCERVLKGLTKR